MIADAAPFGLWSYAAGPGIILCGVRYPGRAWTRGGLPDSFPDVMDDAVADEDPIGDLVGACLVGGPHVRHEVVALPEFLAVEVADVGRLVDRHRPGHRMVGTTVEVVEPLMLLRHDRDDHVDAGIRASTSRSDAQRAEGDEGHHDEKPHTKRLETGSTGHKPLTLPDDSSTRRRVAGRLIRPSPLRSHSSAG